MPRRKSRPRKSRRIARPTKHDQPLFDDSNEPNLPTAATETVATVENAATVDTPEEEAYPDLSEFDHPPQRRCQPEPYAVPKNEPGKQYLFYMLRTSLGTVWSHAQSSDDAKGHLKVSRYRYKGVKWDGTTVANVDELIAKRGRDAIAVLRLGPTEVKEIKARDVERFWEQRKKRRRLEQEQQQQQESQAA